MNPTPVVLVTARLAEPAWAERGMPQLPATGKTRADWATIAGGPEAPLKALPRVSASRQGVIATDAVGGVGTPCASDPMLGEASQRRRGAAGSGGGRALTGRP